MLSIGLCTVYYFISKGSISYGYFLLSYVVLIFTGLLLISGYSYFLPIFFNTYDMGLFKGFFVQAYMFIAMVYAFPLFLKDVKNNFFEYIIVLIIHIFVVQGVISVISFIYEPAANFLISFQKNENLVENLSSAGASFRFYSLSGNIFFDLPATYGLVIILFFRLQFKNKNYFPGFRKYLIFAVLLVGCSFSGRTSFVGMGIALAMSLFMDQNIGAKLKRLFIGLSCCSVLFLVVFFLLQPSKRQILQDDVFPFAFEFFYNFQEGKGLTTASSDALKHMYFPVSPETFWLGDGRFYNEGGGFYKGTDAGYMRQLLFGGIPYIIFLILYQLLFFIKPIRLAFSRSKITNRNDLFLWLAMFAYIFILNHKGDALGRMQIYEALILLLGFAYVEQYDYDYKDDE
jgi:hypothetical protein